MTRRIAIFRVNAFSSQPFAGNPATVIVDAQQLSESEMLSITREVNHGDAVFLLPADGADHDLRVRFFSPRSETGFVGHASIAAHVVLEHLRRPACPRQKQRTGIVRVERFMGASASTSLAGYAFGQLPPSVQGPLAQHRLTEMLTALGLQSADLDTRCPVILAGSGGARALIGVRDGAILARLRPDLEQLKILTANGGPAGFFVFTLTPVVSGCYTEARMFCPAMGIDEDPVSGNAHAMLGHYLYLLQLLPTTSRDLAQTSTHFVGRQGHHVGRPGTVYVTVDTNAGVPQSVHVGGTAVIVFEAELLLPAQL